jgi:hypothetical protein
MAPTVVFVRFSVISEFTAALPTWQPDEGFLSDQTEILALGLAEAFVTDSYDESSCQGVALSYLGG